jgi:hypothetical protein
MCHRYRLAKENPMYFEIDRTDFRRTQVVDDPTGPEDLADGQVLMALNRFAFTANNISYAVSGDLIGYWRFFPTQEPWIRLPVMGYGDVVASRHPAIPAGGRVFGFFPMGDHLVIDAVPNAAGFVDRSPHRHNDPGVYTSFLWVEADADPETSDRALLLRGLFLTSYLADDFLADHDLFGASQVVVVSASSKTAIALAFQLHQRPGVAVVGVTSPRNAGFVEGLGLYDTVVTYDDLSSIDAMPTVVVDMSGDNAVVAGIHRHLGDAVMHSMAIGATHWEDLGGDHDIPGPAPQFFFAPSQITKRTHEWGDVEFAQRSGAALDAFVADSHRWMVVDHASGAAGIAQVYNDTIEGRIAPNRGQIVHPDHSNNWQVD